VKGLWKRGNMVCTPRIDTVPVRNKIDLNKTKPEEFEGVTQKSRYTEQVPTSPPHEENMDEEMKKTIRITDHVLFWVKEASRVKKMFPGIRANEFQVNRLSHLSMQEILLMNLGLMPTQMIVPSRILTLPSTSLPVFRLPESQLEFSQGIPDSAFDFPVGLNLESQMMHFQQVTRPTWSRDQSILLKFEQIKQSFHHKQNVYSNGNAEFDFSSLMGSSNSNESRILF
jgi:hypothetical protein